MTRKRKNNDELKVASDHLHYEIQMLRGTMQLLASGDIGTPVHSNALIESFTIHARVLMDFLYPKQSKESDVLAEDFINDASTWMAARPDEPPAFGAARGRVNKEIAHITYDRQLVTPELKEWDFVTLGNKILEVVQVFLRTVPRNLLGSRWQQAGSERGNGISMVASPVVGKYKTDVSTPGNV